LLGLAFVQPFLSVFAPILAPLHRETLAVVVNTRSCLLLARWQGTRDRTTFAAHLLLRMRAVTSRETTEGRNDATGLSGAESQHAPYATARFAPCPIAAYTGPSLSAHEPACYKLSSHSSSTPVEHGTHLTATCCVTSARCCGRRHGWPRRALVDRWEIPNRTHVLKGRPSAGQGWLAKTQCNCHRDVHRLNRRVTTITDPRRSPLRISLAVDEVRQHARAR